MKTDKIKIGIIGGTGYTGVELLRLLAVHPNAELAVISSRSEAGMPVAEMFPSLRSYVALKFSDPTTEQTQADLRTCDLVFLQRPTALP